MKDVLQVQLVCHRHTVLRVNPKDLHLSVKNHNDVNAGKIRSVVLYVVLVLYETESSPRHHRCLPSAGVRIITHMSRNRRQKKKIPNRYMRSFHVF